MKKIEEIKKLIESGKISMEDAFALADWINEKRPSTQSDPGDHPPVPPPHP